MEDREFKTFTSEDEGFEVRAVFVKDALVRFEEDEEPERLDVFYWFLGPLGFDYWFAYGISDSCNGEDDADETLVYSDIAELKALAVYMGDRWETCIFRCPHCVANDHRDELKALPAEWRVRLSTLDLAEIESIRVEGQWRAMVSDVAEATGGLILSQN